MSQEIVVVSGLPRAGTSLVMQMLAAGGIPVLVDDVRAADADNPRGYFEYAPVKRLREDATWLPAARGHALKVVVPLVRDLPASERYRVLLVRRDLGEVMASQRAMLARRGHAPDAPEREAELLALFAQAMDAVERWLSAQGNLACAVLEHAEILASPRRTAQRIAAALGPQPLDLQAMADAVAPALRRQGPAPR